MPEFEEVIRERFEQRALIYETDAGISGWSDAGLRHRIRLFSSLLPGLKLPPAALVLDLGCGAGTYTRLLGRLGYRVIGLDYSVTSLARAVTADGVCKASYLAGEAYSLPFKDEAFDLVVCVGLLQCLGTPERALYELARVLRTGGIVAVEAANELSLILLARRVLGMMFRRPRILARPYDPWQLQSLLAKQGFCVNRRCGVYIAPWHLPRVARVLDWAVEAGPRAFSMVAHAFFFVAAKRAKMEEKRRN